MGAFGLPFRKRITLVTVNVPVSMDLVRRCDNDGKVCTFAGNPHRQQGLAVKVVSIIVLSVFDLLHFLLALVHSFHAVDSWAQKQCWLRSITARGTDGVEEGCCARDLSVRSFAWPSRLLLSSLQRIRALSTSVWPKCNVAVHFSWTWRFV